MIGVINQTNSMKKIKLGIEFIAEKNNFSDKYLVEDLVREIRKYNIGDIIVEYNTGERVLYMKTGNAQTYLNHKN